ASKALSIAGKWVLSQNKEKVKEEIEKGAPIMLEWATLPIRGTVKLLEKALHKCNKMIDDIMNISPKTVSKWSIVIINLGLFALRNLKNISEFFDSITM
ncbi:MAG: hypothetical protein ACRC1P_10315, partial [Cellulosilyticaceae bacterium]